MHPACILSATLHDSPQLIMHKIELHFVQQEHSSCISFVSVRNPTELRSIPLTISEYFDSVVRWFPRHRRSARESFEMRRAIGSRSTPINKCLLNERGCVSNSAVNGLRVDSDYADVVRVRPRKFQFQHETAGPDLISETHRRSHRERAAFQAELIVFSDAV